MATTIALVDDHHVFRAGLRAILAAIPDADVVAEAMDARQAYVSIESARPDLVILDLVLPDGDGIAVAREIRRRSPATNILILTMQSNEVSVSRALAAGASGFVLKSDEPEEIVRAIAAVVAGQRYVSSNFGDRAAALLAQTTELGDAVDTEDPLASLSRREREVCDLVLRGLTNQGVAEALCISIKTVETHRARINQKLGVHSTGQLIRLAALQGLISA
jgi:DNA-binding NarL/FixJ family response regulator